MRQLFLIILTILLADNCSFGQTFRGTSTRKDNCTLIINKDSSVLFNFNRDGNGIYADYKGRIKKVKDTLYHISATMTFGQFYMKSWQSDTLYIQIDTANMECRHVPTVVYANGDEQKLTYDKKQSLLKFPYDKKKFNDKADCNYVTLKFKLNCFEGVVDKYVLCKIPFGSASSLTANDKEEFDIVISKNKLWTVGQAPTQTGHFKLTARK